MAGAITELVKHFTDPGDRKERELSSQLANESTLRSVNQDTLRHNQEVDSRQREIYEQNATRQETADVLRSIRAGDVAGARTMLQRDTSRLRKLGVDDFLADPKKGTVRFLKRGNQEAGVAPVTLNELTPERQNQIINQVYKPDIRTLGRDLVKVDEFGTKAKVLHKGEPMQIFKGGEGFFDPNTNRFRAYGGPMVVGSTDRVVTPGPGGTGQVNIDAAPPPSEFAATGSEGNILLYDKTGNAKPQMIGAGGAEPGTYRPYRSLKETEQNARLKEGRMAIAQVYGGSMTQMGNVLLPPENQEEGKQALAAMALFQTEDIAKDPHSAAIAGAMVAKQFLASNYQGTIYEFIAENGDRIDEILGNISRQQLRSREAGMPRGGEGGGGYRGGIPPAARGGGQPPPNMTDADYVRQALNRQ